MRGRGKKMTKAENLAYWKAQIGGVNRLGTNIKAGNSRDNIKRRRAGKPVLNVYDDRVTYLRNLKLMHGKGFFGTLKKIIF